MNFNGEQAEIYERDRNNKIVVCPEDCFKTAEAVYQAITFVSQKIFPLRFQLLVELFTDPYLINEGDMGDMSYDFLQFYCESEPHVKVAWVEIDNDGVLEIMMTTV